MGTFNEHLLEVEEKLKSVIGLAEADYEHGVESDVSAYEKRIRKCRISSLKKAKNLLAGVIGKIEYDLTIRTSGKAINSNPRGFPFFCGFSPFLTIHRKKFSFLPICNILNLLDFVVRSLKS